MTDSLDKLLATDHGPQNELGISQSTQPRPLPISIVIVSYNSRELLRACLASTASEQADEVIVIDNASSDGSDQMVIRDFPWVRLIESENGGYGAAANLAIASSSSKYVLLLNSDTTLHPGTLHALCDHLDQHPEAAIVGPLLMNLDGTHQPSCFPFPTPLQTLLRETSLSKYVTSAPAKNFRPSVQIVPWVLGAALAIRRSAFDSVGGFDQSFFMYFEEVDLCYRLDRAGRQTHFLPDATVTHLGAGSTRRERPTMLLQLYKSLCHFYQLHYSGFHRFQLKLVLTYLMVRNMVKEIFRRIQSMYSHQLTQPADDLWVWRTMLKSLWSKNGWLRRS